MTDPQLQSALSRPNIAVMNDADALVAINAPIYTPRTGKVTFATLTAVDVWGFAKAVAFRAALAAVAPAAPNAAAALALIDGPGFDPSDPQAATVAGQLVAIPNSGITGGDALLALNTISYLAGRADVTLDEIIAARTEIAATADMRARELKIVMAYNAAMAISQSGETDLTKIQAAFDAAFLGGG